MIWHGIRGFDVFLHRWPIDSISVTVVVKKYEKWICKTFESELASDSSSEPNFPNKQTPFSSSICRTCHVAPIDTKSNASRSLYFSLLGEQRQNKGRWGVTAARNVHPAFSDEREVPGKFSQLLAPLSACKAGIYEWKCVCAHPLQPFRARRGRRNGHNKKHIAHTTTLVRANEPRPPTITHSDDKLYAMDF